MKSTLLRFSIHACLPLLLLCGCSPALRLTPATGELFVDGQPAEGAMVIFRPLENAEGPQWAAGFPRGTVGADGKFQLSTVATDDGAPPGRYIVLVTWPAATPAAAGSGESESVAPDRFNGRFAAYETSTLRAEIGDRPTTVPRIDLPGTQP